MERPAELDGIRERLEAISEELADLALDCLREAVDDPQPERAALERRLTRARRAVAKAAAVLEE